MKFVKLIQNKMSGSKLRQKVTSNLIWLIIDRIIQFGFSFFVSIWVARYLGPAGFGKMNYALAFVAMFSPICQLGIESVAIKELVQKKENYHQILSSIISIRFFSSILSYILLIFVTFTLHNQIPDQKLVLVAGVVLFASIFDVFDFWFKAEILSRYAVYARTASTVISACLKILAIVYQQQIVVFLIITAGGNFLYNLIMMYFFFSKNKLEFIPKFAWVLRILKQAWPLSLSALSIILYMRIDQIMLGNMVDISELGKYSAAVRIVEAFYFIPMILSNTLLPVIIESTKLSTMEYEKRIVRYFSFNVLCSYLISITSLLFAGIIFKYLYGDAYNGAESIFKIYIFASIFVFLGVARSNVMVAENMNNFAMITTILGAITNILLNLILIPKMQGVGSAIATVISYGIAAYLSTFLFKKTRRIFVLMTESLFLPFLYFYQLFKKVVYKKV